MATDKNSIHTVENHPLEAFDMLKQMLNGRSQTDFDNDGMMLDAEKINHPTHYQSYNPKINIECIDAMRAAFGDEAVAIWCKLNAFKYNWRSDSKGKNIDIGKAIWYLNKYLELNKND